MIDQIRELGNRLATMADVMVELTPFSSGAVMLDVWRGERCFVLAYSPKWGFGVDEPGDDEGFLDYYRYRFEEFVPAAEQLMRLVDAAEATNSQHPALPYVFSMKNSPTIDPTVDHS